MKNVKIRLFGIFFGLFCFSQGSLFCQDIPVDYEQVSQDFLNALRQKLPTDKYLDILSKSTVESLSQSLDNEQKKLAFWINTYNAFIQFHLNQKPDYYEDRQNFFKLPLIDIAGRKMSFADIEHGIIRRSQLEYFLGYVTNPFAPQYEKELRMETRDYRIHFALNCGAKSCPPVAIYDSSKLDDQLKYISKTFLDKFSKYIPSENKVETTSLFSWFRGDFGGSDGIKQILLKNEVIPNTDVKAFSSPYDWTLFLDNYVSFPSEI